MKLFRLSLVFFPALEIVHGLPARQADAREYSTGLSQTKPTTHYPNSTKPLPKPEWVNDLCPKRIGCYGFHTPDNMVGGESLEKSLYDYCPIWTAIGIANTVSIFESADWCMENPWCPRAIKYRVYSLSFYSMAAVKHYNGSLLHNRCDSKCVRKASLTVAKRCSIEAINWAIPRVTNSNNKRLIAKADKLIKDIESVEHGFDVNTASIHDTLDRIIAVHGRYGLNMTAMDKLIKEELGGEGGLLDVERAKNGVLEGEYLDKRSTSSQDQHGHPDHPPWNVVNSTLVEGWDDDGRGVPFMMGDMTPQQLEEEAFSDPHAGANGPDYADLQDLSWEEYQEHMQTMGVPDWPRWYDRAEEEEAKRKADDEDRKNPWIPWTERKFEYKDRPHKHPNKNSLIARLFTEAGLHSLPKIVLFVLISVGLAL